MLIIHFFHKLQDFSFYLSNLDSFLLSTPENGATEYSTVNKLGFFRLLSKFLSFYSKINKISYY